MHNNIEPEILQKHCTLGNMGRKLPGNNMYTIQLVSASTVPISYTGGSFLQVLNEKFRASPSCTNVLRSLIITLNQYTTAVRMIRDLNKLVHEGDAL